MLGAHRYKGRYILDVVERMLYLLVIFLRRLNEIKINGDDNEIMIFKENTW